MTPRFLQRQMFCLAVSLIVAASLNTVYTDESTKRLKATEHDRLLRVIQSREFGTKKELREQRKLWAVLRSYGGHEMNGLQQVVQPAWQTVPKLPPGEVKNHNKLQRRQIAPGYYQAECSKDKNPCKEGKYCNFLYCEDCHKIKMACSMKDQCCKGLQCVYGRCDKSSPGEAGTFCEKDSDCKNGCCILEPTINSIVPLCKPKLAEYHQCADVLYRKIWIGDKPDCGPCQDGLECVQKGVLGSHEVCMKPTK